MPMTISGDGSITGLSAGGLPDASVTQADLASPVYSKGVPAFSAYRSGTSQSVSSNTWTKVQLNSEDFDTASCFDNVTNYRFTPNIAGYYQINGSVNQDSNSAFGTGIYAAIYKNGTIYRVGVVSNTTAPTASTPNIAALIYFNGTTDYIELYGYCVAGTAMTFGTNYNSTSLSGVLVRAA